MQPKIIQCEKLLDLPKDVVNDLEIHRRVYSENGCTPTLNARSDSTKFIEVKKMEDVKILGGLEENSSQRRKVYDKEKLSPTLQAAAGMGGGCVPMVVEKICAMRGRNSENPTSRQSGLPTEQVLEVNENGTSNCLTSVAKDNLVLEEKHLMIQKCGDRDKDGNYSVHNYSNCLPANPMSDRGQMLVEEKKVIVDDLYESREPRVYENESPALRSERTGLKTIKVKQATKQGYEECKIGGVCDLLYPSSETRRGSVQGGGDICPTITALENGIYRIEACEDETHYSFLYLIDNEVWQIRIRKLTPRECGRLQDVSDIDISKMEKVESNSQLYKAFGNSITVNCLTAIFGQMLEGKENIYKGVD